jgi:glucose-6-phosphate isomerase
MALDLSLRFVTAAMIGRFDDLLEESGVAMLRETMLSGGIVNPTESRPALHATDRGPDAGLVAPMLEMAGAIRSGRRGIGGRRIETLVNIGIGGSHLGPAMVHDALSAHADGPEVRFVSNVDPVSLAAALDGTDIATTLFVVSSKSFTTAETLSNAERAREKVIAAGLDTAESFVAVTAAPEAARAWGIAPESVLTFPEGIGGRFSLSGPVGLPVAVAIGPDRFARMLGAMSEMDRHFREVRADRNLPVLHAVITALEAGVLGRRSIAVVAYAERLALLAPYLQQLMMESNGKSVAVDGSAVDASGPAVWGGVGTGAQHAYFQWLHQGTDPTPTEFVIVGDTTGATDEPGDIEAGRMLTAHALAQGEVLAFGEAAVVSGDGDAHRHLPANRPSTRLLVRELSPETIGALVAFYEHSTVVQGWLWGVNPFDQFGVEHGKNLAHMIGSSDARRLSPDNNPRWSSAARWLGRH